MMTSPAVFAELEEFLIRQDHAMTDPIDIIRALLGELTLRVEEEVPTNDDEDPADRMTSALTRALGHLRAASVDIQASLEAIT